MSCVNKTPKMGENPNKKKSSNKNSQLSEKSKKNKKE